MHWVLFDLTDPENKRLMSIVLWFNKKKKKKSFTDRVGSTIWSSGTDVARIFYMSSLRTHF